MAGAQRRGAHARRLAPRLLVGGARHLALVPHGRAERIAWRSPIADSSPDIAARRGRRVVVLASGDPLCYGVGAMLARAFAPEEMIVLPAPSAFALAAARLAWPLEDCVTLSLHGRPLERLRLHLAPGARILALSRTARRPSRSAALLRAAGWGPSPLTVLEHMGGPTERRLDGTAADWARGAHAPTSTSWPSSAAPGRRARRSRGSPDCPTMPSRHDGQITKREVRAATLAALAPLPGELLWDVGAGMRLDRDRMAARRSRDARHRDRARAARVALIAANAAALGVPELDIVAGAAPGALAGLRAPDAVFLGGGVADPTIFAACWQALRPGGRLVANAVTLAGEARACRAGTRGMGGELTRIAVSRAETLGRQRTFGGRSLRGDAARYAQRRA